MYGVGGSSDAISRDMNSLLTSSTLKSDGEFAKIKELISLDPYRDYDNHKEDNRNLNQNQRENSFFTNLLSRNGCPDFLDSMAAAASSPEERLFTRRQPETKSSESDSRDLLQCSLSSTGMKQEAEGGGFRKQNLRAPSMYSDRSCDAPTLPPINDGDRNQGSLEGSASGVMNSTGTNLMRQDSSPAWFLSSTAGSGLSSSLPSSSFLPQITDNRNAMNDPMFNCLKRSRYVDLKMLSIPNHLDTQNGELDHQLFSFAHRMDLPNTSFDMAILEDILHFGQESTPCKIRAKRGFATHPRSIAERVRRTRITERIRKLQELFPNMDKQTNTADMLDMALEHIKDLQEQVQALNDTQAHCVCSSK